MYELEKVLQEKQFGLYYGTRVILPFVADVLKAVIDDDIITDFSPMSDGAYYEKQDNFTEIYFHEHEDILKDVSKYETIKLVIVHEDDDMFNFDAAKTYVRLQFMNSYLINVDKNKPTWNNDSFFKRFKKK